MFMLKTTMEWEPIVILRLDLVVITWASCGIDIESKAFGYEACNARLLAELGAVICSIPSNSRAYQRTLPNNCTKMLLTHITVRVGERIHSGEDTFMSPSQTTSYQPKRR
jgi:hypothetical protein